MKAADVDVVKAADVKAADIEKRPKAADVWHKAADVRPKAADILAQSSRCIKIKLTSSRPWP